MTSVGSTAVPRARIARPDHLSQSIRLLFRREGAVFQDGLDQAGCVVEWAAGLRGTGELPERGLKVVVVHVKPWKRERSRDL